MTFKNLTSFDPKHGFDFFYLNKDIIFYSCYVKAFENLTSFDPKQRYDFLLLKKCYYLLFFSLKDMVG